MDPVTTAMLIAAGTKSLSQLIPQAFKMFGGRKMIKESEKILGGLTRPEMTMPGSMEEVVDLFRGAARRTEIPGQDILMGDIKAGTAGGIEAMLQAGGHEAFGGVAQMVGKEQEAISGFAVPLAQMRLAAEQRLGSTLFKKAGVEMEMEEWNKIQAWKEKYYEAQRRREKGREYLYGGGETSAAIGGDVFSGLLESGLIGGAESKAGSDEDFMKIWDMWRKPSEGEISNEEWLDRAWGGIT